MPNIMNIPLHPQIQRTLAAIVVTDAVGFSRHMSQDEDRALAMINRDLQLISELCEFFEGQILKTVGDGVLMYFVSAVQAAACAVEMQKTFAGFASIGRVSEHFTHRVGVHLGDIFFNQQDMMGTGVNIAARLEAEAKPGAICMSQVVYDVVKSRLELDAVYAGELSLKNIDEAVAAYHVWPLGIRQSVAAEEGMREETTEAIAPLSLTPIGVALKRLDEHPNRLRIKKLLYGTYKSVWENNAAVLERVSLRMLVESLTNRNSSHQECRNSLYQIVGTLNRQEEYTQVAEVILESLKPFYVELAAENVAVSAEPGSEPEAGTDDNCISDVTGASVFLQNPVEALCQDIADQLNHTADPVRMKKVLFCLCYDRWENNSSHIAGIQTVTLVRELHCQITTIQSLHNRLRTILIRLNRKAKYAPIANLIFNECRILYPDGDSPISLPGLLEVEDSAGENTQINAIKRPTTHWMVEKQSQENLSKENLGKENPSKENLGNLSATTPPPFLMRHSIAFGN
ncbi:MAG: Adenylate cyclase, family 3 (some proteins containing HAMP domain) [Phormidesmis priestleyi Ana]|uniref:Adenylate cyclase, family 3 (Some proteins containing HAMP domain) n=1 Tax=Phormidesmis priestleyi Ana TaxID=1666911 RepID=A0A0P8A3W4_9CYAN|nr:MAG: Adenylate cyclase, family 3 (some proteins containing HAMP domain) [Phormidesmis priestleyi Ana]